MPKAPTINTFQALLKMAAISAAQKQWGSARAHLKEAMEQLSYLSEEETGVIDREQLMAAPEQIARMIPDPELE